MDAVDHSRMPSLLADPLEAIWIDELTGRSSIVTYPASTSERRGPWGSISGLDSVPQARCSRGEQLAFGFVERGSALHRLTGLQGAGPRLLQSANSRPLLLPGGGVP